MGKLSYQTSQVQTLLDKVNDSKKSFNTKANSDLATKQDIVDNQDFVLDISVDGNIDFYDDSYVEGFDSETLKNWTAVPPLFTVKGDSAWDLFKKLLIAKEVVFKAPNCDNKVVLPVVFSGVDYMNGLDHMQCFCLAPFVASCHIIAYKFYFSEKENLLTLQAEVVV